MTKNQTDSEQGKAKFTLIVNVPPTTTKSDLLLAFEVFGEIILAVVACQEAYRHPYREWTATTGFAFVRFRREEEAQNALKSANDGLVRVRNGKVRATWAKADSHVRDLQNNHASHVSQFSTSSHGSSKLNQAGNASPMHQIPNGSPAHGPQNLPLPTQQQLAAHRRQSTNHSGHSNPSPSGPNMYNNIQQVNQQANSNNNNNNQQQQQHYQQQAQMLLQQQQAMQALNPLNNMGMGGFNPTSFNPLQPLQGFSANPLMANNMTGALNAMTGMYIQQQQQQQAAQQQQQLVTNMMLQQYNNNNNQGGNNNNNQTNSNQVNQLYYQQPGVVANPAAAVATANNTNQQQQQTQMYSQVPSASVYNPTYGADSMTAAKPAATASNQAAATTPQQAGNNNQQVFYTANGQQVFVNQPNNNNNNSAYPTYPSSTSAAQPPNNFPSVSTQAHQQANYLLQLQQQQAQMQHQMQAAYLQQFQNQNNQVAAANTNFRGANNNGNNKFNGPAASHARNQTTASGGALGGYAAPSEQDSDAAEPESAWDFNPYQQSAQQQVGKPGAVAGQQHAVIQNQAVHGAPMMGSYHPHAHHQQQLHHQYAPPVACYSSSFSGSDNQLGYDQFDQQQQQQGGMMMMQQPHQHMVMQNEFEDAALVGLLNML